MKHPIYIIAILFLLTPARSSGAEIEIKNVPLVFQVRSNWCWAAVCQCICELAGEVGITKCSIQTWANLEKQNNCVDDSLNYHNCCLSNVGCCNQLNILTSSTESGCVDDFLAMFGIGTSYLQRVLTYNEAYDYLRAGNPFILGLALAKHFVLGIGYNNLDNIPKVKVMDPATATIRTINYVELCYEEYKLGWWETLIITTPFDVSMSDDPIARIDHFLPIYNGANVMLRWHTLWEVNTKHFLIEKSPRESNSFYPIAVVKSMGFHDVGATYEYTDVQGRPGDIYRLVEIEESGRIRVLSVSATLDRDPFDQSVVPPRSIDPGLIKASTAETLRKYHSCSRELRAPLSQNCQWLAVYPDSFQNAIDDLITWRNIGFVAQGVTLEYIRSNFGNEPDGIRAYIQDIWETQNHSLKYVVLVGDCFQGPGINRVIPMYQHNDGPDDGSGHCTYESDLEFGDIDSDGFPEIAVGRIPAYNSARVVSYVNKVISYETSQPGAWSKDITFFINAMGLNNCSPNLVDSLSALLEDYVPDSHRLHLQYVNDSLYLSQGLTIQVREALARSEFNAGRGVVLGFGTVAASNIFADWFWTPPDFVSTLNPTNAFSFMLGASCEIGDIEGSPNTVARSFLFSPDRGAIALFGPTGGTWQTGNYEVAKTVFQYLYEWGAPSTGYACMAAQKRVMERLDSNAATARSYIFLGDPAIRVHDTVYNDSSQNPHCRAYPVYPSGKNFFFGCPAGHRDTVEVELNFEFDFGSRIIEPYEVALDKAPLGHSFELYSNGPLHPGYSTSDSTEIVDSYMGGCGCDSLHIELNGDRVGSVLVSVRSCDLTVDSKVNLSDLPIFGAHYNTSVGDSNYSECCDFNGDGHCNLSDFAFWGEDYLHQYPQGRQVMINPRLLSDLDLQIVVDKSQIMEHRLLATIGLGNARNVLSMCLVLSYENESLEFVRWIPNPDYPQTIPVAPIEKDGEKVLFMGSFGSQRINGGVLELGTLEFSAASEDAMDISAKDFKLIVGEVMEECGVIKEIANVELSDLSNEAPLLQNQLSGNYPNPFNPNTVIEYSIARNGYVDLSIYNVAGQLVRTLVSDFKKADSYKVIWDGRDNSHDLVSSGIYLYVLKTETYIKAKKLVVLR